MNTQKSLLIIVASVTALFLFRTLAQDKPPQGTTAYPEYTTIRWAGKENTHLIRPIGKVEFIGPELRKLVKPDKADERAFYMNAAMNGLAKDGFELVAMTSDEIVMKRMTK